MLLSRRPFPLAFFLVIKWEENFLIPFYCWNICYTTWSTSVGSTKKSIACRALISGRLYFVAQFMSHCCNTRSAPRASPPQTLSISPTEPSIRFIQLPRIAYLYTRVSSEAHIAPLPVESNNVVSKIILKSENYRFATFRVYGRIIYANSPAIKGTSESDACFLPLGFRFPMRNSVFSESVRNFHCKFMQPDDTRRVCFVWERKQHPSVLGFIAMINRQRSEGKYLMSESKDYIWPPEVHLDVEPWLSNLSLFKCSYLFTH